MTNVMRRRGLAATMGLAAAVLPLLAAGTAHAEDSEDTRDSTTGYPSTQSPTQGADAGGATAENANESFSDGANGEDRPEGVDGTDTEFPEADPRYLEGPLGGLLNGPFT